MPIFEIKDKRNLEDIIEDAKKRNWKVDTTEFDKGGDYLYLLNKEDEDSKIAYVTYNTCNSGFMIYNSDHVVFATHESDELDGEKWYQEILDMFYIIEKEGK